MIPLLVVAYFASVGKAADLHGGGLGQLNGPQNATHNLDVDMRKGFVDDKQQAELNNPRKEVHGDVESSKSLQLGAGSGLVQDAQRRHSGRPRGTKEQAESQHMDVRKAEKSMKHAPTTC